MKVIVLCDAKGGGGGGAGVSVIMTLIFLQIVWMCPLMQHAADNV